MCGAGENKERYKSFQIKIQEIDSKNQITRRERSSNMISAVTAIVKIDRKKKRLE